MKNTKRKNTKKTVKILKGGFPWSRRRELPRPNKSRKNRHTEPIQPLFDFGIWKLSGPNYFGYFIIKK